MVILFHLPSMAGRISLTLSSKIWSITQVPWLRRHGYHLV